MIDASQDDIVSAYKTIQNEMHQYSDAITKKPQVIVLNKCDVVEKLCRKTIDII